MKKFDKNLFVEILALFLITVIVVNFKLEIFEDDSFILFFAKIRLFSGCIFDGLCAIG